MLKAYSRIVWKNKPTVTTPVNAANLNKVDLALDTIDDRVVEMDEKVTELIEDVGHNESVIEHLSDVVNGHTAEFNKLRAELIAYIDNKLS